MLNLVKLRPSSLNRGALCAQSLVEPVSHIEVANDASSLGSACHEFILPRLAGQTQCPELTDVAEKWDVDLKELEDGVDRCRASFAKVKHHFPSPAIEVPMNWTDPDSGITLAGQTDLGSVVSGQVRILDLKTGWLDTDCSPQMKAYALLACKTMGATEAYALVLRPRHRSFEGWTWSIADLESWWRRLMHHVRAGVYQPGEHCGNCRRWHECPAGRDLVRQWAKAIVDFAGDGTEIEGALPADTLADLVTQSRVIEKACAFVRALVKDHVSRAGGSMVCEDGRELELSSVRMESIKFTEGETILRKALGEQFGECVTVGKGKVEDAIKAKMGRVAKKAAVKDLFDCLAAAGAIETKTVEKLELHRAAAKLEDSKNVTSELQNS